MPFMREEVRVEGEVGGEGLRWLNLKLGLNDEWTLTSTLGRIHAVSYLPNLKTLPGGQTRD